MAQARGAAASLDLQRESVFRTAPGSPATFRMPFTRWNVGRDPRRQDNNTVANSALPAKRDKGDPMIAGDFDSILDLRSIGQWLALALGVPAANKAVTKQPTNVTGVTIHYAEASAATGNGTLAFTLSGTTLTWTAQGDTAGTPVDISAGGEFLIGSNTASSGIYVTVDASAIPAGDQTDADIAVSGTLLAHAFPVNLTDRPSALLELGFSDITKYQRILGAKLNRLSWDVMNNDQNLQGEIIAAADVDPWPTSAFDSTPTSYEYFRACSCKGIISDGASGLGQIVGGTVQLDNQMTGYELAEGAEGYGLIDQGDLMLSGTLRAVFDGASAWLAARNHTSTRLRITSAATIGANTFSLNLDIPAAELEEARVPVEGKTGLFVDLNWRAHQSGSRVPVITLENDVASF